ncbi:MAG: hypothetical protein JWO50_280 [Candidatus Kaiserbacteria bacterium]|nr:hypothetical protein [Candidatus Kaiserbacteria bacterium]
MKNKLFGAIIVSIFGLLIPAFSFADTATITLRVGSVTTGPYTITLPDLSATTTATTTAVTPTAGGTPIDIPALSVLANLVGLDATTGDFDITDLQYSSTYSSFYLRCISVPSVSSSPQCDNWQYTVNGFGPSVGSDVTTLHNGDNVYVYFGYPRSVTLSTTSTAIGNSFTATTQAYDPATNSFTPITGVTIGATQPNPSNPYSPIEIATSPVDTNGQAIITVNATGTYQVGIKEDYYFPTTDITITDAPATTTPVTGGGGSGPIGITHTPFNVPLAVSYLVSQQNPDGSFGNDLYSDWGALALAATNAPTLSTMKSYMTTHVETYNSVTDYERHAMALEALGINPYTGSKTDTISPILAAFDGTQIGDSNLVTDDIFAIFALTHAGYNSSDTIIKKEAAFILSKQLPNGSWEGSVDVTAAAMQALGPLFDIPGVNRQLGPAIAYITGIEQPTGGWNNIDSTSWMVTTINTFNSFHVGQPSIWNSSLGYFPIDALGSAQQSDGAVRPVSDSANARVWSTSYAVVAASDMDWVRLLQQFPKPIPSVGSSGISVASSTTSTSSDQATSTATSTLPVATTTPITVSTSTATSTTPIDGQVLGVSTSTVPTTPHPKPVVIKKKPVVVHPVPKVPAATSSTSTKTNTVGSNQTGSVITPSPAGFWQWIGSWFKNLF